MPSLISLFPLPDFYSVFKEEFLGYNGTHLLFKVKHFWCTVILLMALY